METILRGMIQTMRVREQRRAASVRLRGMDDDDEVNVLFRTRLLDVHLVELYDFVVVCDSRFLLCTLLADV